MDFIKQVVYEYGLAYIIDNTLSVLFIVVCLSYGLLMIIKFLIKSAVSIKYVIAGILSLVLVTISASYYFSNNKYEEKIELLEFQLESTQIALDGFKKFITTVKERAETNDSLVITLQNKLITQDNEALSVVNKLKSKLNSYNSLSCSQAMHMLRRGNSDNEV
jgi:predicted PurR-regulated permease PerM